MNSAVVKGTPYFDIMNNDQIMSRDTTFSVNPFESRQCRIFVAGHRGMVGSAIVRKLHEKGYAHIITRTHAELDLTNQDAVGQFFQKERIDYVVLAAAKVGGIYANNTYPAEFIYTNLMIEANVIHQAFKSGVRHLLFLGSSCIYPKHAPQPMQEEHLLTGILEPTNEPYAIAKIAGIKLCESYNRQYGTAYRSVMPTNLYGPGDNYHLENSHVIPAMLRKFHLAKLAHENKTSLIEKDSKIFGKIPDDIKTSICLSDEFSISSSTHKPHVILWGSGRPMREFLHVDDMAEACLFVMSLEEENFKSPHPSFFNVGSGIEHSIKETADMVSKTVGYSGNIVFDSSKPDGTPRKLLDVSRMKSFGWAPQYSLEAGLQNAYSAYLKQLE